MHPKTNQFTVETLPVGTRDGRPVEGTYALSSASVSPQVLVGRDSLGRPIYEPIPTTHFELWCHALNGAVCKVPMRTGSVFSMQPEAVAYEHETMSELLIEGWIPLYACPFTPNYRTITGTATLVPDTEGIGDCGGKPEGCSHLLALIELRKADFLRKHNEEVARMTPTDPGAAAKFMAQMTEAFAHVTAQATEQHDESMPKRKRPPT